MYRQNLKLLKQKISIKPKEVKLPKVRRWISISKYYLKRFFKKKLRRFNRKFRYRARVKSRSKLKLSLKPITKTRSYQLFQKSKESVFLTLISTKHNYTFLDKPKKFISSKKIRSNLCKELKIQVSKKIKIKKLISYTTKLIKRLRQKKKEIKYISSKKKKILTAFKHRRFFSIISKYRKYLPTFKFYFSRKFKNSKRISKNPIFLSRLITSRIINQLFKKGKKIKSLKIFLQLIKDFQRLSNKSRNFRVFLPRFYKLRKLVCKFKVLIPSKGKKKKFRIKGAFHRIKVNRNKRLFFAFKALFVSVKSQKNRIPFNQQLLIELLKIFTGRRCVFYELVLKMYKKKMFFKKNFVKQIESVSFKYNELPNKVVFNLKRLKKKINNKKPIKKDKEFNEKKSNNKKSIKKNKEFNEKKSNNKKSIKKDKGFNEKKSNNKNPIKKDKGFDEKKINNKKPIKKHRQLNKTR